MRRGAALRAFEWQPPSRLLAGPCEYLLLQKLPQKRGAAAGDAGRTPAPAEGADPKAAEADDDDENVFG